jgi:hypothetical protein
MSAVATAFQIWWVLFTNGYVPVGGPLFPESQLRRLLMALTPMSLLMLICLALSLQINAVLAVALAAIGGAAGLVPSGGRLPGGHGAGPPGRGQFPGRVVASH